MSRLVPSMMLAFLPALATNLHAQPPGEPPRDKGVHVRALLPDGAPASGALIGANVQFQRDAAGSLQPRLSMYGEDGMDPVIVGGSGGAVVPWSSVPGGGHSTFGLIAHVPGTRLMAVAEVGTDRPDGPIELRLTESSFVTINLASSGLRDLGGELSWTNVYVFKGAARFADSSGDRTTHEFLLPPGKYRLMPYGTNTYTMDQDITVGIEPLKLDLDLIPTRLMHLIGRPAPELNSIKAWKNGGPTTLADLRGKVVILDFWGYWCGPCIHSMPHLMELHDRHKDKGLVIVAVHDDSVESIEKMDALLANAREQVWEGRDLPFLIALDGGREMPIPGGEGREARGATTAAYGIQSFPTAILIDRAGNVVGRFNARANTSLQQLEAALKQDSTSSENGTGR